MANYQSIPARFNKAKSRINHQYIDSVLKDKQNTIDTNFGLMQQSVEKVLGQDLIREEDREMLKNKVSNVLNALGQTDSIKFDSKKSRFFMQDALSQAAKDPEVLKQVANTKRIREFNKQVQEAQKKGDFNYANYEDAKYQAGLTNYMNGSTSDLGSLGYVKYYDSNKELREVFNDVSNRYKEKTELVEVQGQPGKYKKITTDGLTPEQTREMVWGQLSAQAKQQIGIDGRVGMGFDTTNFDTTLKKGVITLEETLKERSSEINKKLKGSISDGERENLEKKLKYVTDTYNNKITVYNDILNSNLTTKATYSEKMNRMGSLITDNYNEDYLSGIYETQEYKERVKQEAKSRKVTENLRGPSSMDIDGNGVVDISTGNNLPAQFDTNQRDKTIDAVYKKIQEEKETFNSTAGILHSIFNEDQQKHIKTVKDAILLSQPKISDYQLNRLVTEKAIPEILKQFEEDSEEYLKIKKIQVDLGTQISKVNNIEKPYIKDYDDNVKRFQESRAENLYKEIQSSPKLSMINQHGKTVNVKNELAELGISNAQDLLKVTKGDFSSFIGYENLSPEEKEELQKKAGYLRANLIFGAAVNNLHLDFQHKLKRERPNQPKNIEDSFSIEKVKEIKNALNLKGEIEDYVDFFKAHPRAHEMSFKYKSNTPLFDFIQKASEAEGEFGLRDTLESIGGDLQLFNLSGDEFRKFRLAQDDRNTIQYNPDKFINILPPTTAKEVSPLYRNLKNQLGDEINPVPTDFKGPFHLVNNQKDNSKFDVYIQTELETGATSKGDETKSHGLKKQFTIDKSLVSSPELEQIIDTKERKDRFEVIAKAKEVSQEPILYSQDSNVIRVTGEHFLQTMRREKAERYLPFTTQEGFEKVLDNSLELGIKLDAGKHKEAYKKAKGLKNEFNKHYDNYRVKLSGSQGSYSLQLINKNNTKEVIYQQAISSIGDSQEFETLFHGYPSVLIGTLMSSAVRNLAQDNSKRVEKYYNTL